MKRRHLVEKLKEMRRAGAPDRRMSAMTHLFGIIFAEDIPTNEIRRQIAAEAGDSGWAGLIKDGQNLADYVEAKPEHLEHWRR